MRIFFLLSLLFVFYSCNNDLNTIGDTMIPADGSVELTTYTIDETYTIRLDSFPTSVNVLETYLSSNQLTLGKITDDVTGVTTATPYFQIIGNGFDYKLNFDGNYTYDSLTLALPFDLQTTALLAGDTTQEQTFYLYRLKNYPRMDYDEPCIYNNYKLDYYSGEENRLATLKLRFEKNYFENSIRYFKLKDDLGEELFEKMMARDSIFIYPYDFMEYFSGLVIVPDKDNSALIPLNTTSLALQCHYHAGSGATGTGSFLLPAAKEYFAFTNVEHQPTPELTGISWFTPQPFSKNNMAIIQGLDGYMLKLKLPYLPPKESYKAIIKVEIELKPRLVNYENIPEPGKNPIQVFVLDKYSRLTSALSDLSGNPVYGYLQSNPNYPDQRRYVIDITDYYISMVSSGVNLDPQLNLAIGLQGAPRQLGVSEVNAMVGANSTSFERLILDDIPVLKIYEAKYK